MEAAIENIFKNIRPKIKDLVRTRHIHGVEDMIHQFKTHIWGYIEYINGCVCHAIETYLNKFDNLQNSFLRELDISPEVAVTQYNCAPITLRRDIGLLGFIHKRILGQCHDGIKQLLPLREKLPTTNTINVLTSKCIQLYSKR